MKKKKREEEMAYRFRRILLPALAGLLILVGILIFLSISSRIYQWTLSHGNYTTKACLMTASMVCGALSAGRVKEKRFIFALAGESVLFVAVSVAEIEFGFPGGVISYIIDLTIMLIGAFAGTLFASRRRK